MASSRPGIKPPPDPAAEHEWKWSEWVAERDRVTQPGWTYCRFPIQYPGDRAVFVFGIVRANFGIYPNPIKVRDIASGQDTDQILYSMVHMPTGIGLAMFADNAVAAGACVLAEKVEPDWANIDPRQPETWSQADGRLKAAWWGIGIKPAENAFAYRGDGSCWRIFGLTNETVMSGRPERLS